MSETTAVLVTSIDPPEVVKTTVESLVEFPSESSPSSLMSNTLFEFPGLPAIAWTELFIDSELAASWDIV